MKRAGPGARMSVKASSAAARVHRQAIREDVGDPERLAAEISCKYRTHSVSSMVWCTWGLRMVLSIAIVQVLSALKDFGYLGRELLKHCLPRIPSVWQISPTTSKTVYQASKVEVFNKKC